MSIMTPDVGCDVILKAFFNNTRAAGGNNLTLKLFTNNVTPAQTDTASTYTEAAGGGYAAKTLTAGSWTVTAANDPSDAVYALQTFTFTGALTSTATVYGYYVVDADGVLVFSEAITPFQPANNGDAINITPKFQMSAGTPA